MMTTARTESKGLSLFEGSGDIGGWGQVTYQSKAPCNH